MLPKTVTDPLNFASAPGLPKTYQTYYERCTHVSSFLVVCICFAKNLLLIQMTSSQVFLTVFAFLSSHIPFRHIQFLPLSPKCPQKLRLGREQKYRYRYKCLTIDSTSLLVCLPKKTCCTLCVQTHL